MERSEQLHIYFSIYLSILVQNDLEGSPDQQLGSLPKIPRASKYTREPIPFTMEPELAKRGKQRAKALGGNFSTYSEELILKDLRSPNYGLEIVPTRETKKPRI
jgi:hypothetical protein